MQLIIREFSHPYIEFLSKCTNHAIPLSRKVIAPVANFITMLKQFIHMYTYSKREKYTHFSQNRIRRQRFEMHSETYNIIILLLTSNAKCSKRIILPIIGRIEKNEYVLVQDAILCSITLKCIPLNCQAPKTQKVMIFPSRFLYYSTPVERILPN